MYTLNTQITYTYEFNHRGLLQIYKLPIYLPKTLTASINTGKDFSVLLINKVKEQLEVFKNILEKDIKTVKQLSRLSLGALSKECLYSDSYTLKLVLKDFNERSIEIPFEFQLASFLFSIHWDNFNLTGHRDKLKDVIKFPWAEDFSTEFYVALSFN